MYWKYKNIIIRLMFQTYLFEKTCIIISVEKYQNIIFSRNDETSQEHIIVYMRAMIITLKCQV